jgi:hypothetical protein
VGEEFEGYVCMEWALGDNLCRLVRTWVLEISHVWAATDLGDMVVQPLSAVFPSHACIETVVVACHVLEYIVHFLSRNLRE